MPVDIGLALWHPSNPSKLCLILLFTQFAQNLFYGNIRRRPSQNGGPICPSRHPLWFILIGFFQKSPAQMNLSSAYPGAFLEQAAQALDGADIDAAARVSFFTALTTLLTTDEAVSLPVGDRVAWGAALRLIGQHIAAAARPSPRSADEQLRQLIGSPRKSFRERVASPPTHKTLVSRQEPVRSPPAGDPVVLVAMTESDYELLQRRKLERDATKASSVTPDEGSTTFGSDIPDEETSSDFRIDQIVPLDE
jgi:hypothetical protein